LASLIELDLSIEELDIKLSQMREEIIRAREVRNPRIKSEILLSLQAKLLQAAREIPFILKLH
jgi:hypothetical protein